MTLAFCVKAISFGISKDRRFHCRVFSLVITDICYAPGSWLPFSTQLAELKKTTMLLTVQLGVWLNGQMVYWRDLLLRKTGRVTKKVTSCNIRSVDMYAFRTDLCNVLESATQSESADPLSVYNTCLRQALDHHHAPLVTRTVTDHTSAPWMTLEVKQAKVERHIAERKWHQSGLTVHREIYAKQRNVVSNLIRKAKKDYICEKIIDW